MRSLLGLSFVFVVGCSNACPPPVLCTDSHPDYCPCTIPPAADTGPVAQPDAYVDPGDAGSDAATDAGDSVDANVDVANDAN